jgi:hypothetical protein
MSYGQSFFLALKMFKNGKVTYATPDVLMAEVEAKRPFGRLVFRYCKGYIINLSTVRRRCPSVDG